MNNITVNGNVVEGLGDLNFGDSLIDCSSLGTLMPSNQSYTVLINTILQEKGITFSPSLSQSDIQNFLLGNSLLPASHFSIDPNFNMTFYFLGPNGENVPVTIPASNLVSYAFPQYYFAFSWTEGFFVLGENLFAGNVVFFDRGEGSRIGFAPATGCFDAATTSGIDVFATGANIPCPSCDPKATCVQKNTNCTLDVLMLTTFVYIIPYFL